jgi:hypothetical protein
METEELDAAVDAAIAMKHNSTLGVAIPDGARQ